MFHLAPRQIKPLSLHQESNGVTSLAALAFPANERSDRSDSSSPAVDVLTRVGAARVKPICHRQRHELHTDNNSSPSARSALITPSVLALLLRRSPAFVMWRAFCDAARVDTALWWVSGVAASSGRIGDERASAHTPKLVALS